MADASGKTVLNYDLQGEREGITRIEYVDPFGSAREYRCGRFGFTVELLEVPENAVIIYYKQNGRNCISSEDRLSYTRKEVAKLAPDMTVMISKGYKPVTIVMKVCARDNSSIFTVTQTVEVAVRNATDLFNEHRSHDQFRESIETMAEYFYERVLETAMEIDATDNRHAMQELKAINEEINMDPPQSESFMDYLDIKFANMKWKVAVDKNVQKVIDNAAQSLIQGRSMVDTVNQREIFRDILRKQYDDKYFADDYKGVWDKVLDGAATPQEAVDEINRRIDQDKKKRLQDMSDTADAFVDLRSKGLLSDKDSRAGFYQTVNGQPGFSGQPSEGQPVKQITTNAFDDDDDDLGDFEE